MIGFFSFSPAAFKFASRGSKVLSFIRSLTNNKYCSWIDRALVDRYWTTDIENIFHAALQVLTPYAKCNEQHYWLALSWGQRMLSSNTPDYRTCWKIYWCKWPQADNNNGFVSNANEMHVEIELSPRMLDGLVQEINCSLPVQQLFID